MQADGREQRDTDRAQPAAEVAHGVGGDVATGERGTEQDRGADDGGQRHDLGERLARAVHRDEHRRQRPRADQNDAEHAAGAERHAVADRARR